jgi:hypothetical protein
MEDCAWKIVHGSRDACARRSTYLGIVCLERVSVIDGKIESEGGKDIVVDVQNYYVHGLVDH